MESNEASEVKISFRSSILLLPSIIIGTGIFMSSNSIVQAIPSITYSMIIWVCCGIISLFAALSYAELGLAYPSIGGEYTYFKEVFHDMVAFSCLIANLFIIRPASIALLVRYFSENVLSAFIPNIAGYEWAIKLISIAATIFMCALNCSSEKWTIRISDILTYTKFVCMICIIMTAIVQACRGKSESIADPELNISVTASDICDAIYNGMWAYDGFNILGFVVGKMDNPGRILVPSSIIGMSLIIVFYCMVNMSYFVLLGTQGLKNASNVVESALRPSFGGWIRIITIMVSLSAIASANSTAYSGGNLYYNAARNGHLPRLMGASHKSQKTYIPSLIWQAIMTIIYLALVSDMGDLLDYFSGASWIFYTLVFLAAIVYRYRPNAPIRLNLFIGVPVLTLLIGITIIILGFYNNVSSLISLALVVGSIPIYLVFITYNKWIPKSFTLCVDNMTTRIMEHCSLRVDDQKIQ